MLLGREGESKSDFEAPSRQQASLACSTAVRMLLTPLSQIGLSFPQSSGPLDISSSPSSSSSSSLPTEALTNLPNGHPLSDLSYSPIQPYSDKLSTGSTLPISTPGEKDLDISPSHSAPAYSSRPANFGKSSITESNEMEYASHLPKAVRRSLNPTRKGRWSRPFRIAVDVPRGCLQAVQQLIHYLLM